ncbi:PepSY domain-containing protein [Kaistia terrae]|jgi:uncharacterized membrane protein YkoI|uniref:PepSY domain-containing protein n=1 Tax=Kaistia terrae TaxID=537017 RepID=A0ABW0PU22_9HYPH|nr:hypothetical protein [Kaistia terrae]MCX5576882.1 hypothetical protein [Kaistia terrae]
MSKNFIVIIFLAAIFVWFGSPQYGPTAAYGDSCLSQGEARQAVQKGDAISLSEIRGSLAGDGGEVVSAQLCKAGNRLVYVVNVLGNGGEVKRVRVDARTGSIMGR